MHNLDIKLAVGQGLDSKSFHVVELKQYRVKKFCMFYPCTGADKDKVQLDPASHVIAKSEVLVELNLFKKWVASSFCVNEDPVHIGKNTGSNAPQEARNSTEYYFIRAIDIRNSQALEM